MPTDTVRLSLKPSGGAPRHSTTYPFGKSHRWEMPTGGVKAGEALEAAAHRELRSEIRDAMTMLAVLHAARLRGWR